MGLDMYVYRAKKPSVAPNRIYEWDELYGFRCRVDDVDAKCEQLLPFCEKVKAYATLIDKDKIIALFELKEDAYISVRSKDFVIITDGERNVELTTEEIREKYAIEDYFEAWFCELEEVHYWRKAYEVADWFGETMERWHENGNIENCGFYNVPNEMIREYNREFPEDPIRVELTDDEDLFYHEWG